MNYRLVIRPEAECDIDESFSWYEDQIAGLGHEFRFSLGKTFGLIRTSPYMFPSVYLQLRRALIHKFPHAVFFFVEDESIIVVACAYHKRDLKIWQNRV